MDPGSSQGSELLVLLGQLTEPEPPPPVPMWPATAGWLWLGLAVLALLAWGLWRWHRARRAMAWRREALALLGQAQDRPGEIALILRRAALSAYPRREVAGLAGRDWLRFLDATGGGSDFTTPPGSSLASAPYHPLPPDPELTRRAARWLAAQRLGQRGRRG